MNALTLYELNMMVRDAIEIELSDEYWVQAELAECRESRGHCYMELVQKEDGGNTPIARASAKCWRQTWQVVQPYFERTTGQPLRTGLKVLLKVYAQFHEAYGFSWIVTDIDPTYTLGDLARRRQEIVAKLKQEGVFDLQRELELPVFCKHIAVISSETAAGYGDFCRQLSDNPYGFVFDVTLFPAIMQGEEVEASVIAALNQIYSLECRTESVEFATATEQEQTSTNGEAAANSTLYTLNSKLSYKFDCVVIIRGGGATSDMSGFDTLALAEHVANFPIPIITGIGHERDECVLDMVSHTRVKTPTAAAALLIDHLKAVLDLLNDSQDRLAHLAEQKLITYHAALNTLQEAIPRLFSIVKTRQEARLDTLYQRILSRIQQRAVTSMAESRNLEQRLLTALQRRLTTERHRMEIYEEKVHALDPALLLKRGYSITTFRGKAVRDPLSLQKGDEVETRLALGTIRSVVKEVRGEK